MERPYQDGLSNRSFTGPGFLPSIVAGACCVVDFREEDAARRRQHLSFAAIRFGFALFAWPWRQRRAKDHGIIAVLLYSHGRLGSEFHIPFGSCCLVRRPWASALCSVAGALSTQWGRGSPSSRPCRVFAPRPPVRSRCSWRPGWACPFRPLIQSLEPSSVSAQHAACRQCAGT